jgi:hypothetical protein
VGERLDSTIYMLASHLRLLNGFMLLIRPQPVETVETGGDRRGIFANTRLMVFPGLLPGGFAMYLPQPLSPNFLQNQRGLSLTQIGLLYSVLGLGNVVMNLVLGQMEARLGYLLAQVLVGLFPSCCSGEVVYPGMPWAIFVRPGFRAARTLASAHARSLVKPLRIWAWLTGWLETVSGIATILAPCWRA